MRQIILDTETTGIDPELGHRIIEIGAIVIQNREITQETFHAYLNPERESEAGALAVHGLSQTFLQDKPLFSEVIENFLAFLTPDGKRSEVIIHNAKFDAGFFNAEIKKHNSQIANQGQKELPTYEPLNHYCKIVDSLKLAREMHPNQRNSLDALCKRYDVDNSNRSLHGALLDAELLAQVYLKMTSGQSSFFDALTANTQSSQRTIEAKNSIASFDLPIYYASKADLNTHTNQLARIRKESGVCLWEDK